MEIDTQYSLSLLEKVNNIQLKNMTMSEYFFNGEYSPWTAQQFFLLTQIKEFSKTKSYSKYQKNQQKSFLGMISTFLFDALVVLLSLPVLFRIGKRDGTVVTFCSDFLSGTPPVNHRLFHLYTFLRNNAIPYVEIVHITTIKNFFVNLFIRRRRVLYYESLDSIVSVSIFFRRWTLERGIVDSLNLDSFNEEEQRFVQYLIFRALCNLEVGKKKIILLARFLKLVQGSQFVSIDDMRYLSEILLACKNAGVPSYIFQHSNFDYLIGLDTLPPEQYIFPDTFLMWNTYWQKRIGELSPLFLANKEKCVLGGRIYNFVPNVYTHAPKEQDTEKISVLIPYEVALTETQIRPYIKNILGDERIHIFFLPRGDFERHMQIEKYFGDTAIDTSRVTIFEKKELYNILPKVDVVAGVYTGFLDEAIEMCVPVAIFETEYVCINRLDRAGVAGLVVSPESVYKDLKLIAATPGNVLQERKRTFTGSSVDINLTLKNILER